MDFEDILLDVGDYGKFQRKMINIFLLPAAAFLPWFCMDVLFMVSVPDHWCNVPEVVSSNWTIAQQRSIISPPGEQCRMYNISFSDIDYRVNFTVPNGTSTKPCDMGWQYDKTNYDATAASQFNLVCDDAHFTSFVLSMYNVGSIIGTPIYGALSDRYGRRITFFIIVIVTAVSGMGSVLATTFATFVAIKTINGSLYPTIYQLPYIIVLEIVAPEMRTRMNGITNLSWVFGMCFLPLIAYLTRSWVTMGLVNSSVTLLLLLYYKFLPESPRWLVSMGKYDDAATRLCQIAETNGKIIERKDILQKLQKLGEKMEKDKGEEVTSNSCDLIRYPQLRKKFIIVTFCWISNVMAYYGLQLNISNLAGSEFVNFFLLSISEIPGYLTSWYVMERFGRRWCSVTGFLLTGLVCMLPAIEFPYGDVISSMLGKFFAAGTFMATYQQSSELYPTVVRSLGMGMSSTISLCITLVVPYLVYLAIYGKAIPFIVIGIVGLIAGVMAAFLPETLNENLPQTLFDAEEFGKNHKFLAMNRRRCSVSRERAASITAGSVRKIEPAMNAPEETDKFAATQNIRKRTTADIEASYENATEPQEQEDSAVGFKDGSALAFKAGNISSKSDVNV